MFQQHLRLFHYKNVVMIIATLSPSNASLIILLLNHLLECKYLCSYGLGTSIPCYLSMLPPSRPRRLLNSTMHTIKRNNLLSLLSMVMVVIMENSKIGVASVGASPQDLLHPSKAGWMIGLLKRLIELQYTMRITD